MIFKQMYLTGTTTPGQRGTESNGNEGVLLTPLSTGTGGSPSYEV